MTETRGRRARPAGNGTGGRLSGRLSGFVGELAAWTEASGQRGVAGHGAASVRTCPYCTERIDLRRCDVVSAVRGPVQPGFDNLGPAGRSLDAGGGREDAPGAVLRDGYELLFDAHPPRGDGRAPASLLGELMGGAKAADRLVPVTQFAPPQKMPRRRCELCHHLLPAELDGLDTRILAVVGVTGAGKTHYLAQALTEASKRGGLSRFGCSEFAPTDADHTAHTLHNDYYAPVVRKRVLFSPTNPTEAPTQFNFTVAVGADQFLLVTHDIAGESLADPDQRAQQLTFLRHADAMIFLLDPVEFDAVRARLPEHLLGQDKPADQVHLLRQCLRELDQSSSYEVPVRVVVAKADLIASYCGIDGPWQRPPAEDWRAEIAQISDGVRQMLTRLGETEVLRLLAGRERTLFHAVSSLGAPPGHDGRLSQADPLRCSDPLGTAILGMTLRPIADR